MKYSFFLSVIIMFVVLAACRKFNIEPNPLASLTVVNAITGGGTVKLNTVERDSAKNGNWRVFGIIPGGEINIYPTSTPNSTYYQNTKTSTEHAKSYSVFLGGITSSPESIFQEEWVPANYTDSSIGVRIINLSPNSVPFNVTLQSNTGSNLFTNVAYKQITSFTKIALPTTVPASSVSFQVRSSAAPATVLATYTLPVSVNSVYPGVSISLQRFKNITIVIKGLQGITSGENAFGVFPVPLSF